MSGNKTPFVKDDNIDLFDLLNTIWGEKKIILRSVIVFTFLGIMLAFLSTKEFTAKTTIVPQISSPTSDLGGLSSIASLAGFNLDMNSNGYDISPVLYPQIVNSIPFQLELMEHEYSFEDISFNATLFDYFQNYYQPSVFEYIRKYTVGFPAILIKRFRAQESKSDSVKQFEIVSITHEQEEIRRIITKKLTTSINEQDGYITLTSRFHQAYLSAQVAKKAQILLQEYITNFRIEKARSQFDFIYRRYMETKSDFEIAQKNLAEFKDANKNIYSAIAQTEEAKLENEFSLSFDVYSELAKQLEQARIKVKEDTPMFSVLEDVVIPIEKSKPKRSLIIIVFLFLGALIGVIWVIGKEIFHSVRLRMISNDIS